MKSSISSSKEESFDLNAMFRIFLAFVLHVQCNIHRVNLLVHTLVAYLQNAEYSNRLETKQNI